jgi:hypothetical protein
MTAGMAGAVFGCQSGDRPTASAPGGDPAGAMAAKVAQYTPVRLTADLQGLTEQERRMIPLLIAAATEMDSVFQQQIYPARDSLVHALSDSSMRRYIQINYGPWDRLDEDRPFVPGVGPRPPGAELYPHGLTKEELERAIPRSPAGRALAGQYTVVRRDSAGQLVALPYHEVYAQPFARAAARLREAAALAEDPGLRRYLQLRAKALETDDYQPSDFAWLDMKTNTLDIVIGPIESYIDQLVGRKTAAEAYVLLKDKSWSARLAHYAALLPELQHGLPVPDAYKRERPGTDSDLNAYDALYYAGEANAGSKTIAINLPNDEEVQLKKGTRRLQLKNAVRAKFDRILVPIARELIVADQIPHVTFDAFFENVMFHEVAHGLGIKNTLDGKGTVRAALKERHGALEEGKADILGLYMLRQLNAEGQLGSESIDDNYVTFLASLFRSVRFGAADAHGRANIVAFNFLQRLGAFTREPDGKYRVDVARMRAASDSLSRRILVLQGDGDYAGVGALYAEFGKIDPTLQGDLERLKARGIPVDIIYDQGR